MKYLCIDSNIYRNIFSPSESFPDEIKDSLLKLVDKEKIKLLLPLQIKQEVERDRFSSWYDSALAEFTKKIKKKEEEIDSINKTFEKYRKRTALVEEITKDKKELEKIVNELKKRYKDKKSKSNQILKEIFLRAELISESEEIISKADLRIKKRNPPRDSDGHFGDSIIWESLLTYFRCRKNKKRDDKLILVSNDKKAWGSDGLDLWLKDEWCELTGSKITLVYNFSDIPDLTSEDKDKIKPEEADNLKENIISDFISSSSWINAGSNAQKLLTIKDKLTRNDLERIMLASLENHEIYGSFYTPIPLENLISDSASVAIKLADQVDDDLWMSFREKFHIKVIRRKEIPF